MEPANAFPFVGRLVYHFENDWGHSRTGKLVVACSAEYHGSEESNLGWNGAYPYKKRILHYLVDSFTINQNYYQITRTSEFVVIEVKVFQLRALPNFGRNRTWQRISVNW